MKIPGIDLSRVVQRIGPELDQRWKGILEKTAFVNGDEVRELEERFAEYVGAVGCVGVANGTDALVLALRALGASGGDEVLVPAFSFFATVEAVILVGATPVFVDVEPDTLNIDPVDAARKVGARTVGILGVHLYGRAFNMAALGTLAESQGLWILEDAAQAHGARFEDRPVGSLGQLAAWSFYPTKNLGCFGDGGAVTGPDADLLARVRSLANHGQVGRYQHAEVGTNSRLDSLQAAVLNCRLTLLEQDNEWRRQAAARYREGLAGVGDLRWMVDRKEDLPVYHQVTLMTDRRDELAAFLNDRQIGCSVHYPSALHQQAALEYLGAPPHLPVAEAAGKRVLCLPVFPEIREDEVDQVVAGIREFFS